MKSILPIRHNIHPHSLEARIFQNAILRAGRGAGEFFRRARLHIGGYAGRRYYLFREIEPAAKALACAVENSALLSVKHCKYLPADADRPRRRAELVVHDF